MAAVRWAVTGPGSIAEVGPPTNTMYDLFAAQERIRTYEAVMREAAEFLERTSSGEKVSEHLRWALALPKRAEEHEWKYRLADVDHVETFVEILKRAPEGEPSPLAKAVLLDMSDRYPATLLYTAWGKDLKALADYITVLQSKIGRMVAARDSYAAGMQNRGFGSERKLK